MLRDVQTDRWCTARSAQCFPDIENVLLTAELRSSHPDSKGLWRQPSSRSAISTCCFTSECNKPIVVLCRVKRDRPSSRHRWGVSATCFVIECVLSLVPLLFSGLKPVRCLETFNSLVCWMASDFEKRFRSLSEADRIHCLSGHVRENYSLCPTLLETAFCNIFKIGAC